MKTAAKLTFAALGCAGLAGLALWWLADHRRGIAWAVSVVRGRFPDVSICPRHPSTLGRTTRSGLHRSSWTRVRRRNLR